jgi:glycosyltransferase involved in cell wall biosynthesis
MALWCEGFPTVTAPRGDTPKPVTFIYPYYENPVFLLTQMTRWRQYADTLKPYLSVIVVDDGSPTAPARKALKLQPPMPFLRMFRIDVDVRWNWLAARNIGFHHASDGWCLVTDMDHVVPEATLEALVYGLHDPKVAYAFTRCEHTGPLVNPHSASFFLTRQMFWKVGGYDEALSGHYGTDGTYRRELAKHARIQILKDELVRYEYVADSSSDLKRKDKADKDVVKKLVAARGKSWRPKVLSFPYREVTA